MKIRLVPRFTLCFVCTLMTAMLALALLAAQGVTAA
jgi:hypothetical protein